MQFSTGPSINVTVYLIRIKTKQINTTVNNAKGNHAKMELSFVILWYSKLNKGPAFICSDACENG